MYFSANTKAFGYEADMVGVTFYRSATEFEIKRSRGDFFADFKNKKLKHKILHSGHHPANYFYFACESNLIRKEDVPFPYGLIWVIKETTYHIKFVDKKPVKYEKYSYDIKVIRRAKRLHERKLPDDLLIKLLTSVMYKYFTKP